MSLNSITLKKGNKKNTIKFNEFGREKYADRFMLNLIKMLKVNTIKSDIMVGLEGDSFYTNMFAGTLLTLESSLLAVVSTKKRVKVLRAVVLQNSLESDFRAQFSFSISLCLLQIIAAMILSIPSKKGEKCYGKSS